MLKYLLIFTILFSIVKINAQDRYSDSLHLVNIYNKLDGDNWKNNTNWLSSEPLEKWYGIGLWNNRVSFINTRNNNMVGEFPSEIYNFTNLLEFDLSGNPITGEISDSILLLTNLKAIIMESCKLSGEIPKDLNKLPKLERIIISRNQLTGSLPNIGDKVYLVYLYSNQLSGKIPDSWRNKIIFNLNLSNNLLTGTYDILSTWKTLSTIDLSNNNWDEHPFPNWLSNNVKFSNFGCQNCNITGDIPQNLDFTQSKLYTKMYVPNNNLSGDISPLLPGNNKKLKMRMDLSSNNFSGTIKFNKPFYNFEVLDLRKNKILGFSSFQYEELNRMYLSTNNLTFSSISPILPLILNDSVNIQYFYQNKILDLDSFDIYIPTTIDIYAGDEYDGIEYKWFKNDIEISGENSSHLILEIKENNQSGNYHCKMTHPDFENFVLVRNNVNITTNFSTSTNEKYKSNIIIKQNPVKDLLTINFEGDKFEYEIIDMTGKVHLKSINDNSQAIFVYSLTNGPYIIRIKKNNEIYSQKFIKY